MNHQKVVFFSSGNSYTHYQLSVIISPPFRSWKDVFYLMAGRVLIRTPIAYQATTCHCAAPTIDMRRFHTSCFSKIKFGLKGLIASLCCQVGRSMLVVWQQYPTKWRLHLQVHINQTHLYIWHQNALKAAEAHSFVQRWTVDAPNLLVRTEVVASCSVSIYFSYVLYAAFRWLNIIRWFCYTCVQELATSAGCIGPTVLRWTSSLESISHTCRYGWVLCTYSRQQ